VDHIPEAGTIKILSLLERSAWPLLLVSLLFISTTFCAFFIESADLSSVAGINVHRALKLVDLRQEITLATWFSSIVFLAAGVSFILLGWGSSPAFKISRWARFVFQISAIGAILLSADEAASIHETAGKWFQRVVSESAGHAPVLNQGYFWIILYAPFLLGSSFALALALRRAIATMPINYGKQRRSAYLALLIAIVCLPSVVLFEISEWWLASHDQATTILPCFEEMAEVIGMYCLLLCALLIARQFRL
jgi:hypothetical protein